MPTRLSTWLGTFVALMLLLTACTSADTDPVADNVAEPTVADRDEATPDPAVAPPTTPPAASPAPSAATPTALPTPAAIAPPGRPTVSQGQPLGAYLVAKRDAGSAIERATTGDRTGLPTAAIPVYDQAGGEPRHLLEVNEIDGVALPLPLYLWGDQGSPTVLRVVEGSAGDDWIRVQAPTRPHNTMVWVSADDFEWATTTRRIEIDLAAEGLLTVYEGDEALLEAPIVQGRDSRVTPTHVTYLEAGALGEHFRSPAYGHAVLMMASFSEELGTFGGGSPQNFLHGTNEPGLMGQRVSSGEIRVTDETLIELIDLVHPGVPVLLFDSSPARPGRDEILAAPMSPAQTMAFSIDAAVARSAGTAADRVHPQLWARCDQVALVCARSAADDPATTALYATAANLDSEKAIPVFDEIRGPRRTLVDANMIDGVQVPHPLFATTSFGKPLVLRVVERTSDGEWLRVQVPVRPNGSTVWVRGEDFVVESTTVRVEVTTDAGSVSPAGGLRVIDGSEVVLEVPIASGRESRPTPHFAGWVGQIIDGTTLSPAYGPWVLDLGQNSEALGSFGGGQPRTAIRGTNQPDTVGERVTSGSPRLTNEAVEAIVAIDGILGAPVIVTDQPFGPDGTWGEPGRPRFTTRPAITTGWLPTAVAVTPSFA